MNSEQRQNIRGLVKKYSDSGTESLIAFVAETDGLFSACQELLHSLDAAGSTSTEWLQRECSEEDVQFHAFLEEVIKIVTLFQPSREGEDHHTTLGVSADAGLDEIKQAYRALSRRYHPDTASSSYRDNPEKFIAINKAYHALLNADSKNEKKQFLDQEKQWRRKKTRSVSTEQRRKVFIWTLGLLIIFGIISTIASLNYKKRAMLAGLQESRGAFIPPVRKASGVSIGKGMNVEKQPTELPSLPVDNLENPEQELVAMVREEPKIEPLNVRLKELPQKEFAKEIATQAIANKEQRTVKQPGKTQPSRIKEKIDISVAAHAAPSSALESVVGKESSEVVDGPRQINSIEPDVIFNTKAPAPADSIGNNTEREAKLTPATVTEVRPLPAELSQENMYKQEVPDMQTRVNSFFSKYTKAYEQRNLLLFSRFFEPDAEENSKPFTTMLPTYLDLFAATSQASLQIEQKSWQQVDSNIAIDGRFKIYLKYIDGRIINGSGPIEFVLVEKDGEFFVKKMKYIFKTE